MTPHGIPHEILQMIGNEMRDNDGRLWFSEFNAFAQANRVLYASFNRTLWQEATQDNTRNERVITQLIATNNIPRLATFLELGCEVDVILPAFNRANTAPHRTARFKDEELEATALLVAADRDNIELASLLLKHSAKVQSSALYAVGTTGGVFCPLHAARSAAMVDLLVDHGADPEWEVTHQLRPLHWCAIRSDIGAMLALIRRGAAVNPRCRMQEPLHDAASHNLLTVELLLDHGADARARDDEDNAPLHCAAAAGKTDVVRFFLQRAGESICDTNVRGETALHLAAEEGKLDVVQILVEMWPDGRRLKTGRGTTPLHLAVASVGSFEGLELLIDGCQEVLREKNDFGNSPVDLAIMFGNQDIDWWDQL